MDTNIPAFEQAITDLMHKAGDAAVQYGPQALSLAEQYLHAVALLSLIKDVIAFLLMLIAVKAYTVLWKITKKWVEDEEYDAVVACKIIGAIPVAVCILLGILGVADIFSPQTFFGVFYPKLAVMNYAMSVVQSH